MDLVPTSIPPNCSRDFGRETAVVIKTEGQNRNNCTMVLIDTFV